VAPIAKRTRVLLLGLPSIIPIDYFKIQLPQTCVKCFGPKDCRAWLNARDTMKYCAYAGNKNVNAHKFFSAVHPTVEINFMMSGHRVNPISTRVRQPCSRQAFSNTLKNDRDAQRRKFSHHKTGNPLELKKTQPIVVHRWK
jgi:hypothetical protein